MKSIIYIIAIVLLMSACDNILEENPKSIAVETFYNTSQEVEAALNAIYSPIRAGDCMGQNYFGQMTSYADYAYGRGTYAALNSYDKLDDTNISRVGNMWTLLYRSVRNANICIANIPNATSLNDIQKSNYLGEAKFLRAYTYFLLIQSWGGVPKRTEENMEELAIPRATEQEIWDLIISDMEFAKQNLPEKPRAWGTPSVNVAKTVLAEIYMHVGKYTESRNLADEVIRSGEYSLLQINEPNDFLKLYGPGVTHTSEEIFYLKYSRSQGWAYVHFLHTPNGLSGANGVYGQYTDSENEIIKNWDRDDLRYQFLWYPKDIALGANTLLCKKFQDVNAVNGAGDNDAPLYRYADLLLFFAESEARVKGVTSDAVEALNQVHRRAYGFNPTLPSSADYNSSDYSVDEFLNLVIRERGYETVFEGKRWKDLKRLGIVKEVIKKIQGVDMSDSFLLWPIPVSEMDYNKALDPIKDQNPGY
ncbi:MAG: RagB/SusD family nutrient uptake outer membrane protein [Prevotella sp.]|jgi:hypothetical protein|nr:RagB/SusD family nutrient uptake outer membrane protein [Prevotella sp.]